MSKEWSAFCYKFIEREGWKTALSGLSATLRIAVFGLLIGIIIGIIIAAVRLYPKYKLLPKILSGICNVYVAIFRGTPIVVQLLVGYYVLLPAMGVKLDSMIVAIIIFGMNSGAYVSEIMRSGMQAVDPGQMEAARALGLTYNASMMKIVIPQGIKNIRERIHLAYKRDLGRQLYHGHRPHKSIQADRGCELRICHTVSDACGGIPCACTDDNLYHQNSRKEAFQG